MKFTNYVRTYILLIVCSCTFGYSSFGAASQILIKGKISMPGTEGLTINLHYCPDYYAISVPTLRGIKYSSKVKDGSFEFRIENPASFAYIQIEYGQADSFWRSGSWNVLNQHLYLIGPDSVISITINNDQCIFSEKSKLLECQYKMYEFAFKDTLRFYIYNNDFLDTWKRSKAHYDSIYREQLKILKIYENTIQSTFAEVLKLDFFADRADRGLVNSHDPNDSIENKAFLQYYLDNYLFVQYDTSRPNIKILSRSYANFLFKKQYFDIGLMMRITSATVWPSFSQLMDKIDESYSGVLKEKILASSILYYMMRGEGKLTDLDLDIALGQMKTEEYKSIFQRIKDTRGYGRPAFYFNLLDSSMQIVTPEKLKGKFVILDFWFTGCGGCAYLNEKMTPVYDYFKNNSDVVFVTISIDKDIDIWRDHGLKSGRYTHPGSLNLYTNGLGDDDPVIKYYDVMGYPTLILIDKEGRIVSGSPPKPVTPESCKRFIDLVEKYL